MTVDRDETDIEQAVDEMSFAQVIAWDLLADLVADKDHAWQIAQDVAFVAADEIPDGVEADAETIAGAAAMIGMALGVQAERVRQRRHGPHRTEVA